MPRYRFGNFEFESDTGRLWKLGLRVKLQRKPQMVLGALIAQPGKAVSRKDLYALLWPQDTFVDFEQGLSVAVKKLRAALGDSSDQPDFIETLAGASYRFIGTAIEIGEITESA